MRGLSLFLLIVLSFTGCETTVDFSARLLTTIPETALWVEAFHRTYSHDHIEVLYAPSVEEGLSRYRDIDLVISEETLPASRLFPYPPGAENPLCDPDSFYPGILAALGNGSTLIRYPLSFSLPVLAYATDSLTDLQPGSLTDIETIIGLSADHTTTRRGAITRIGFFPGLAPSWVEHYLSLFDVTFLPGPGGRIVWDQRSLEGFMEFLTSWYDRAGISHRDAVRYRERYLTLPPAENIRQGRATMVYLPLSSFFMIPEEARSSLDFVYLSHRGRVPAIPPVTTASILRDAPHRDTAEHFVRWLLSPEGQEEILAYLGRTGIPFFGLAGGLSTLVEVSEGILPRIHPRLAGKIPPPNAILFTPPPREEVRRFYDESFLPWLEAALEGEAGEPLAP